MKAQNKIKDIIMKIFGKARWFLIIMALCLVYGFLTIVFSAYAPYTTGIREGDTPFFIRDIVPEDIAYFTINDGGTVALLDYLGTNDIAAVYDNDTKEKIYTNLSQVTIDAGSDEYFFPRDLVITDDGVIYTISTDFLEYESNIISKDYIHRITEDYKYSGTVCEIDYDISKRLRKTKLSKLHYFDGAVTFAEVEDDGVWLYSVDTDSQALSKSDFYPSDPDGTYTTKVIPVDGSFLFLRSDGNVYSVGFNEPLGESIYKFDISVEDHVDHPYFDLATVANGKLYVADSRNLSTVYILENGEVTEAFNIDTDYKRIVSLDSYRSAGSEDETIVACLDNGIFTYNNGVLRDDTPVIRFDPTILMYLDASVEVLFFVCLGCVVINLIVRKKTLLYKQLIITLPVIVVITILIASKLFSYFDQRTTERINKDLTVICDLAMTQFDDYDFSDLLSADKMTGTAYTALNQKLNTLSSNRGNDWSNEYIFSIVYRTPDDDLLVLSADDTLYMPLNRHVDSKFSEMANTTEGIYIDNSIQSFFADDYNVSTISVFGNIRDKDNTGNYYLMVSTDTSSLYEQRSNLFGNVVVYSFLIIIALTLIIVLSFLNTMRVIKKASKAVKKISNGDLSARVNYKSNDELGQICSEVDEMGKNLETLFAEKDKTEQFYYKFVPEKFRELLGKEKFTDLSLGDAKSCELTVLFTDIRGFSINSEMMTAKENFAFANIIYGKMGPIVRKNNGFVDKYIGDAVMGLFENADDAVRCGIELYKTIVLDPKTAEELNVSDINIGIGVHTGMAMVGIVGEEERLSGTVISETVNMSSRLESLTKQYHTAMLISKSTVDRMKDPDSLDLRYLGIVQVAGVNEVEAIYEVLDCLSDENRELRSSNSKDLREAIRIFSLGRRGEAADYLQALKDSGKSDYVTDLYLNYIRGMSDDDKGNVFRFVKK